MDDPQTGAKSWWATIPGLLTAIAGVITAVAGLVGILVQAGMLKAPPSHESTAAPTPATGSETSGSHAPVPTDQAQAPGAPVEAVAGLRPQAFKGIVVTHRDGTVTRLLPGARIAGQQAIHLANGQNVEFDKLVAIDIDPSEDDKVVLLLVNGKRLPAKSDLSVNTFGGKNELGEYSAALSNVRRIEFLR